jgi:DNA-binding MarR family transcriptional regulator
MDVATGYLVWRLTMKWRAAVERAVGPLNLTHAQYTVLASLSGLSRQGTRPSQRELADFTGLEQVYVSKLVRALERTGFVERTTHPADPRAVQLALTDRGLEVIDRAIAIVHALHEELLAPIGGTRGPANRELRKTLLALLGSADREGVDMTQATTLFGQDLGVASAAGRRVLTAVIERDEISVPQWVTMKLLDGEGGKLASEALAERLAAGLNLDAAAIGATLGGLRARGLVAGDGTVGLTDDGQALYDRLAERVGAVSVELLGGMPAEDLDTARRVLIEYTHRATALIDKGV